MAFTPTYANSSFQALGVARRGGTFDFRLSDGTESVTFEELTPEQADLLWHLTYEGNTRGFSIDLWKSTSDDFDNVKEG